MKKFRPTSKAVLTKIACGAAALAISTSLVACGTTNVTRNQTDAYNAVYSTSSNEYLNNYLQNFGVNIEESEDLTIDNAYLRAQYVPDNLLVNINGNIVLMKSNRIFMGNTDSVYWADENNAYAYSHSHGSSYLGDLSFMLDGIHKSKWCYCYILDDNTYLTKPGDYVIETADGNFFPAYKISEDVAHEIMIQMQKNKPVVYAEEAIPLIYTQLEYEPTK